MPLLIISSSSFRALPSKQSASAGAELPCLAPPCGTCEMGQERPAAPGGSLRAVGGGGVSAFWLLKRLDGGKGSAPLCAGGHGPGVGWGSLGHGLLASLFGLFCCSLHVGLTVVGFFVQSFSLVLCIG